METKLIEYFDDHYYKITRDEEVFYFPSVTTVLGIIEKYGLDRWRGDIGNREADHRLYEASNKGKRIHKAWELFNAGLGVGYHRWQIEEKPECDFIFTEQGEYLDFLKLVEFRKLVKPVIVHSEKIVYSFKHQTAGTVDNVFSIQEGEYLVNGKNPLKLNGGLYIADVKTGNSIYAEAIYQVSAYAEMYKEIGLGEIEGCLILHTNASTRTAIKGFAVRLVTKEEIADAFRVFLNAFEVWKAKNKSGKPTVFEFPQTVRWEDDV